MNNPIQKTDGVYGNGNKGIRKKDNGFRKPTSVLKINKDVNINLHPTQKPVALIEYLIKTYTNEGDTVLDNCAGSFTTAVACENTNRKWICIEKEKEYFDIGINRLNNINKIKVQCEVCNN